MIRASLKLATTSTFSQFAPVLLLSLKKAAHATHLASKPAKPPCEYFVIMS